MPRFELDLDPLQHITTDAIGQPGQRVFYLQGWRTTDPQPVTVILEKIQVQSLAVGVEQLLAEVARQHPQLDEAPVDFKEEKMRIHPPVDPLFRTGELGLGYDEERDLVVLLVREIQTEGDDPEQASVVRFWCSRAQARRMARWAAEVIKRGRPICPQCGEPIEPEGHFCPKKNGHRH
ncbi:MAG: DUF3090 domain-containing protein [Anaerolineales bacterium]|nr:DUF3090 domain-containing protein [Anaerolineales bacterium]